MTKIFLITAFFYCFGLITANGQSAGFAGKSIVVLQQEKIDVAESFQFYKSKMTLRVSQQYPSLSTVFQTQATPKIYAFEELTFFCKIEVELEKAAGIPVKFRLGSVPYVDRLEGKTEH